MAILQIKSFYISLVNVSNFLLVHCVVHTNLIFCYTKKPVYSIKDDEVRVRVHGTLLLVFT